MKRRDKTIRYQAHARRQMRRRGISVEQVERCVRKPDAERPARRSGAKRLEKKLSARTRVVVIAEEGSTEVWIVTAFKA